MTSPKFIKSQTSKMERTVSVASSPPPANFSPSSPLNLGYLTSSRLQSRQQPSARTLKPFNTSDIKILLLENVNQTAVDILTEQGYQVEFHKTSLDQDTLIEKIKDVHAIGIRSKTKLPAKVLAAASNLEVIGCFCIGTNQVDLEDAAKRGIAVFNSPFSNSRSVAELVIAEIITLARQLGDRSIEMHAGTWNKVSNKCWEIRGKTLGIIGYGHIGSQLSVLAESMGMRVVYYDILMIMSLGTARQLNTLDELLALADFVTCHVPELPETMGMISTEQFAKMKIGSYIINASRGSVIDIEALIQAHEQGIIAGAALDVYPHEPPKNGVGIFNKALNPWAERLLSLNNVILTPHIGGSTEEAQKAIGMEVATTLVNYINQGISVGAVNFPEVNLRAIPTDQKTQVRVLYIHQNVPGVLRTVNEIFANHNIEKQFSDSVGDLAYLMADISDVDVTDIRSIYQKLVDTPCNIKTRLLY